MCQVSAARQVPPPGGADPGPTAEQGRTTVGQGKAIFPRRSVIKGAATAGAAGLLGGWARPATGAHAVDGSDDVQARLTQGDRAVGFNPPAQRVYCGCVARGQARLVRSAMAQTLQAGLVEFGI